MLHDTVVAAWAVTLALTAALLIRIALILKRDAALSGSRSRLPEATDPVAVERLLEDVGGVVELIEADSAGIDQRSPDRRSLGLASALLTGSMSRYRDSVLRVR